MRQKELKRTFGLATALALIGAAAASALEIPLKQGSGSGGGTTVGYVDMEEIFQEYPETHKAKAEYFTELATRRKFLADREKELADAREQLAVLRTTLKDMEAREAEAGAAATPAPPAADAATDPAAPVDAAPESAPASLAPELGVSPGALAAVKDSLAQRENDLLEKEAALEQARAEAVKRLKAFEESRTLQIFGKLYDALVQLAEEQGVGLVVDKSSILYGQSAVDLTEKLRRRVRGLPDEDAAP